MRQDRASKRLLGNLLHSRVDQCLCGISEVGGGILRAEHAGRHIGVVHEQKDLIGKDIGFFCACLLRQLAEFYTDGLLVFDCHLMARIIGFRDESPRTGYRWYRARIVFEVRIFPHGRIFQGSVLRHQPTGSVLAGSHCHRGGDRQAGDYVDPTIVVFQPELPDFDPLIADWEKYLDTEDVIPLRNAIRSMVQPTYLQETLDKQENLFHGGLHLS